MSRFNPYQMNGGTILAIAGKDFCVIGGDTRQSEGYSIQTRYAQKVYPLTDNIVLACTGFAADGQNFVKKIKQRLEWYAHAHSKQIDLKSLARLVQTMLYSRRMFPYYTNVILAGIDPEGVGAVYSFDPVGSYERETCRAAGSAASLLQPLLDNQVYFRNQTPAPGAEPFVPGNLPLATILALVTDAFTGATERHIEVGDGLEAYVIMAKSREGSTDLTGEGANLPAGMTVEKYEGDEEFERGFSMYKVYRALKRD